MILCTILSNVFALQLSISTYKVNKCQARNNDIKKKNYVFSLYKKYMQLLHVKKPNVLGSLCRLLLKCIFHFKMSLMLPQLYCKPHIYIPHPIGLFLFCVTRAKTCTNENAKTTTAAKVFRPSEI